MQSLPAVVVKIARNGEDIGDFSWSDVRPLIACGSILPTDHFWYDGMAEWRLVSEQWPAPNKVIGEDLKQVVDAPVQKVQENDTAKLMPCPSCERQISTKARACPHCGHPLLGLHMQTFGSRMEELLRQAKQDEHERRERQNDIKTYLSAPANVTRVLIGGGGLVVGMLTAIIYSPLFGGAWLIFFLITYALMRNGEQTESIQHCAFIGSMSSFLVAVVFYFFIGPFLYPSLFPPTQQNKDGRARAAEGEAILEDMERYNANPRRTQAERQAIEKRMREYEKKVYE